MHWTLYVQRHPSSRIGDQIKSSAERHQGEHSNPVESLGYKKMEGVDSYRSSFGLDSIIKSLELGLANT
eukprot:scaffold311106_cov30-Prasinocladus_malaysianus.AAC.1